MHAVFSLRSIDRGFHPPAGHIHGPDQQGRINRLPRRARTLPAVRSLACPWSQRALIVRRLLGLDRVIGLSLTDPVVGEHGWRFPDADRRPRSGHRGALPVRAVPGTDPGYQGECTLPMLWDTRDAADRHATTSPQITMHVGDRVHRLPPAGLARPLPGRDAARNRRGRHADLLRRQHRRVQGGARHHAGGVRGGLRRAVHDHGRAGRATGPAQVPARQRAVRGGRAAVPDAGQVRCGLLPRTSATCGG